MAQPAHQYESERAWDSPAHRAPQYAVTKRDERGVIPTEEKQTACRKCKTRLVGSEFLCAICCCCVNCCPAEQWAKEEH
jgi:hypothetical protein